MKTVVNEGVPADDVSTSTDGGVVAELVEFGAHGAEERFHSFFRAEFPRLAGYCAGLLADREAGADVAQEALVRTYARWLGIREPHAYAYLVATNLIRRAWRRDASQRQALAHLHRTGDRGAAWNPDGGMRDLVDRLPEKLRVPVLLHYYADLSIDDVARVLHRPAGTVRRHLHEARAQLGAQVGAGNDE